MEEQVLIQISEKRYRELLRMEELSRRITKNLQNVIHVESANKSDGSAESIRWHMNAFCEKYSISILDISQ